MTSILDISKAQVYFDGIFSEPKLAHPEGVAIGCDGIIYCGKNEVTFENIRLEYNSYSDNLYKHFDCLNLNKEFVP